MDARKELIAMLEKALNDVARIDTAAGTPDSQNRIQAMELISQALSTLNDPNSLLLDGPSVAEELGGGQLQKEEH